MFEFLAFLDHDDMFVGFVLTSNFLGWCCNRGYCRCYWEEKNETFLFIEEKDEQMYTLNESLLQLCVHVCVHDH